MAVGSLDSNQIGWGPAREGRGEGFVRVENEAMRIERW